MNAEFDWWLLLVGIVAGAALVWLVVGDMRRRDDEVADDERSLEAEWIAEAFRAAGRTLDAGTVAEILDLHRAYLAGPAPELDPVDQVRLPGVNPRPTDGLPAGAIATNAEQTQTGVPADDAPDMVPPAAVPPPAIPPPAIPPPATPPAIPTDIVPPVVRPQAPGPGGGQPRRAPGDGS